MAVGTDIVFIPRIKDIDRLANRILSKRELQLFEKSSNKQTFLAGRFAAKEAFIKALEGKNIANYAEIEVLYKETGAPYISFKDNNYAISIAHDGDYAIAVAVI